MTFFDICHSAIDADAGTASASATMAAGSNISVRPASMQRQVAPARRIVWIVATPITGTSKRMS